MIHGWHYSHGRRRISGIRHSRWISNKGKLALRCRGRRQISLESTVCRAIDVLLLSRKTPARIWMNRSWMKCRSRWWIFRSEIRKSVVLMTVLMPEYSRRVCFWGIKRRRKDMTLRIPRRCRRSLYIRTWSPEKEILDARGRRCRSLFRR